MMKNKALCNKELLQVAVLAETLHSEELKPYLYECVVQQDQIDLSLILNTVWCKSVHPGELYHTEDSVYISSRSRLGTQ